MEDAGNGILICTSTEGEGLCDPLEMGSGDRGHSRCSAADPDMRLGHWMRRKRGIFEDLQLACLLSGLK